ncbi:MAG: hypothetical protein VKL39_12495 [Leptolyngbyaceae bacterium]|nr:hypothetical protein [Leptolyngbyaceae bacterium]
MTILAAVNGLSVFGENVGAIAQLPHLNSTSVVSEQIVSEQIVAEGRVAEGRVAELTPEAESYNTPSVNTRSASSDAVRFPDAQEIDLDRAAQRAKEASDQIYRGLDRTKREIGKTDLRKQAIEHGRDHASDKWEALAEKARRAQRGEATLSPIDRFNLWRLQRGNR